MYRVMDTGRKIILLRLVKLRAEVHWDDERFSRELQGGP